MTAINTLYETDFYQWALGNAALLKAGRFGELDIEHLVEEIESMSRSERRELLSRLVVLVTHLLKWHYQPERQGNSWKNTIKVQRLSLHKLLAENPSLKPQLVPMLVEAYEEARLQAAAETDMDDSVFPEACPFSLDEVFRRDYFPNENDAVQK